MVNMLARRNYVGRAVLRFQQGCQAGSSEVLSKWPRPYRHSTAQPRLLNLWWYRDVGGSIKDSMWQASSNAVGLGARRGASPQPRPVLIHCPSLPPRPLTHQGGAPLDVHLAVDAKLVPASEATWLLEEFQTLLCQNLILGVWIWLHPDRVPNLESSLWCRTDPVFPQLRCKDMQTRWKRSQCSHQYLSHLIVIKGRPWRNANQGPRARIWVEEVGKPHFRGGQNGVAFRNGPAIIFTLLMDVIPFKEKAMHCFWLWLCIGRLTFFWLGNQGQQQ